MMETRWFIDDDGSHPVPVQCPEAGYPHKDSSGRVQQDETHFDTEEAAWERGRLHAESNVRLAASMVRRAKDTLADANAQSAAEAVAYDEFLRAMDRALHGRKSDG